MPRGWWRQGRERRAVDVEGGLGLECGVASTSPRLYHLSHGDPVSENGCSAPRTLLLINGKLLIAPAAVGVGVLALLTAVLVVLAMQPPDMSASTPAPNVSEPAAPTTSPPAGPTILFIGDDHLEDWASDAAEEIGAQAVIESGVALFDEPTVADALGGVEPNVVVLSIGVADEVDASTFQAGLVAAIDAINATWPDARLVLMRPAWENVGPLEVDKTAIVELVAAAREAAYLDTEPAAEEFADAWVAARG